MLVIHMNFVLSLLLRTESGNKYFQFYFSINLTLMEISRSLVLMPNQRSVFSFVQQDRLRKMPVSLFFQTLITGEHTLLY